MEFMDLTPQPEIPIPSTYEENSNTGEYHDVELNNFMSRPIRIANITWSYATAVAGTINPWTLFFTDTRVKNRLAYYNLLKCKLCVKFVVNGNAFQYGQMFVDYLPLKGYTINGNVLTDGISPIDTSSSIYPNVQTHRKYIKIRPLDSQGACMELPFFWPNNFMSIPLEEWQYQGSLRYYTVNQVLHANNSSATDPPIISVFAWAEDVKLSVPTAAPPATLLPQSGTETVGAISGPASAVSRAAGSLSSVPGIGGYAKATQMVATGIGSAAKLFGFSRAPIETPTVTMKPDYTGNLANTDRPENISKLTIDSSQEVTIDPTVTGIAMGDELSIGSIAAKETYLTQFTWDFSQTADTSLFHIAVNPLLHGLVPGYSVTRAIYPTALEFASIPFRYWKGSLKFRFEVIASKFHKGRLRLMYDPKQIPVVTDFNKNYQTILDLDSGTDLTVKVHWAVPQPVLNCGTLSLSSVKYGPIFAAPSSNEDNGCLYMYVLNNLSVPSQGLAASACLAYVNVYVSACDDFELCVPDDGNLSLISTNPPFIPASGVEMLPSSGEEMMEVWEVGSPSSSSNFDLVLFGEKYLSFRPLLKRYVQYMSYLIDSVTATNLSRIVISQRRVPLFAGSDSVGVNSIPNLLGAAGNYPGNNIKLVLLQYLMCAYSGMRGSFRYKYQQFGVSAVNRNNSLITVVRKPFMTSTAPIYTLVSTFATLNNEKIASFTRDDLLWNGAMIANNAKNPSIEVEDPYYEKYRFLNPKTYVNNNVTISGGHQIIQYGNPSATDKTQAIMKSYLSTGEDFNLMYYTGPGYLWTSAYY